MLQKILGINSDFESIFFKNESKILSGIKFRTVVTLLVILFLTFLALGFAVGSLGNLEEKMDNPFTNWVNVPVSDTQTSKIADKIVERYNKPEQSEQFYFRNSGGFVRFNQLFFHRDYLPFLHPGDSLLRSFWGRTIEVDEPLFKTIISETSDNLIWVSNKFEEEEPEWNQCEIIISEEMMRLLGFDQPEEINHVGVMHERIYEENSRFNQGMFTPLKVVGVVRKLPDTDFVCAVNLYNALNDKRYAGQKRCRVDIIKENKNKATSFQLICEKESAINKLESLAFEYFENEDLSVDLNYTIPSAGREWAAIQMNFMPIDAPDLEQIQSFIKFARRKIPVGEFSSIDCDIQVCSDLNSESFTYLAFHFEKLDKVKAFQEDLLNTFGVKIDMTQVESKNNFALVTKLTYAISLILLGFGILSILLFVNNLLRTHLFKVRSNLGTFQAFGLRNNFLVRIYLKIILTFLGFSILIAFLLSVLVDLGEGQLFGAESRFDIFNYWVYGAIALLFFSSWFLSHRTIKNILGDTPGNLIYGR